MKHSTELKSVILSIYRLFIAHLNLIINVQAKHIYCLSNWLITNKIFFIAFSLMFYTKIRGYLIQRHVDLIDNPAGIAKKKFWT